jgi:hypothetical protein
VDGQPIIANLPGGRARLNVVQVGRSLQSGFGPANPAGPGRVEQVRVRRDGTFSLSTSMVSFCDDKGQPIPESHGWRTVGGTYGGPSGAAAVLVVVEGMVGLANRQQMWSLQLAGVLPAAVTVTGREFMAPLAVGGLSLRGLFVYPSSVFIEVEPGPEGGTYIRAQREKPGEDLDRLIDKATDNLEAQIDQLRRQSGNDEEFSFEVRSVALEEEGDTERDRAALRDHQLAYLKLLQATSSIKMGAPDRKERTRSNWICVLTLQVGPPPPIRVLDATSDALLTVGSQTVIYRENLVEFGGTNGVAEWDARSGN